MIPNRRIWQYTAGWTSFMKAERGKFQFSDLSMDHTPCSSYDSGLYPWLRKKFSWYIKWYRCVLGSKLVIWFRILQNKNVALQSLCFSCSLAYNTTSEHEGAGVPVFSGRWCIDSSPQCDPTCCHDGTEEQDRNWRSTRGENLLETCNKCTSMEAVSTVTEWLNVTLSFISLGIYECAKVIFEILSQFNMSQTSSTF